MKQYHQQKKRINLLLIIGLGVFFFIFSIIQLGIGPQRLLESTSRLQRVTNGMFPPEIYDSIRIGSAALESLQIAVLGTFWGIIFSLVLSIFAAKNLSPHWTISYAVKGFAALVRSIPALIWALLFIVAVGLGPTPGILALAVNSIGMLVKVYAETIEEVEKGTIEAIKATGGGKFQVIMQGVFPSISSIFITWSVFRFDINIRYAAVLGIVGAGGIGWELVRASQIMAYNEMLGITIVIFLIVLGSEMFTRVLKNWSEMGTAKAFK